MLLFALTIACSRDDGLNELDEGPRPQIAITSPAAAAWLGEGAVEVTGTFENLRTIDVNEAEATPDRSGTFVGSAELSRGVNVIEAYGTTTDSEWRYDRVGVLAGEFADPGHAIEDAAGLRLNQPGIDAAMDFAGSMVDQETIAAAATGMNPIYEDTYGVWGWDAVEIAANVDDITFDTVRLEATPRAGMLELQVVIPNLFVDLQAVGEAVGWDFDVDASLWADEAQIEGQLTLDADNGKLVVELLDADVNLVGFGYDTSLLPGDVEAYLFVDTIRGKLEDMLLEQITTMVPPLLESTLAGLDLSFELELMGVPLSIGADFAQASIDSKGIAITTDIDVDAPSNGEHTYAGFLSAPVELTVDDDAAVGAAISDDLLNRLMFEVWRAGLLELTLSTDDGSLEPALLLGLKTEQGTITLDALLPPVVVQGDSGLEVQIGELNVTVDTPGGEFGEHLEAAINLNIPLDLGYSDGNVVLALGSPEMVMMVRESDWGAEPETITQLLTQLLPLDSLLSILGDITFAVPSLDGLSIKSADVQRDKTGLGTHIGVELD
ncbi:MAG: hypothetical protein GY913_31930 [Proteobacteria bacterium]|nr:hypothetical protein [Pseudomonadota bacterium]